MALVMHVTSVSPQFACTLKKLFTLITLVRPYIPVGSHMFCKVFLTFEKMLADHTSMWSVITVGDDMPPKICDVKEISVAFTA